MQVADLLQLQRALPGHRHVDAATDVHEVAIAAVVVGQARDVVRALQHLPDRFWQLAQRPRRLLPAFEGQAAVHVGELEREQVLADHVGDEGLGRGDRDLRARVQVDASVGVSRGRAADHVGDRQGERASLLGLPQPDQRVGGFARLRDDHGQGVGADRRPPVAELRCVLGPGGNAGPVLDHELAQHRGMERGAHAEQAHLPVALELLAGNVEFREIDLARLRDPPPQGVGGGVGRLADLLQHEVRVAALLGLGNVPVDVDDLGVHRLAVERGDLSAERGHRRHLALAQDQDLLGVRDDCRDVGGDEVLAVADPDHQRRVEPGADQKLGIVEAEHGQRVGAVDPAQGLADSQEEVAAVVLLDQVGHDLGVGLRGELVALALEFGLQLGEVLDDSVVHDRDAAPAVGVRMRVDDRRLAVGCPPGVPDAQVTGRHVVMELGDQVVNLGLALGHAGLMGARLHDGDARRVVAAVFEALQRVHEDGRRLSLTQVADDSAHMTSCPANGQAQV